MPTTAQHFRDRAFALHHHNKMAPAHHTNEDLDDARSDQTLDDVHQFGHPLERMVASFDEEDEPYDWQYFEDNQKSLHELQDQRWTEAQQAIHAEYDEDNTPPSSYRPAGSEQLFAHRHVSSSMVTMRTADLSSDEVSLAQYLNSESMRLDPWNHAVPTLEILEHDQDAYLMMLRLLPYDSPPLNSTYDCLDFTRQLLEGVAFFHEHKIARLDLSPTNIGMDVGLAPTDESWDRADYPVRYYVEDLSSAIRFDEPKAAGGVLMGTADWVDEMVKDDLLRCKEQDIGTLGANLRILFGEIPQLRFLSPLLSSMASHVPSARPTAQEALTTLDSLTRPLDSNTLHRPFSPHHNS